jgi:hypothetical protein
MKYPNPKMVPLGAESWIGKPELAVAVAGLAVARDVQIKGPQPPRRLYNLDDTSITNWQLANDLHARNLTNRRSRKRTNRQTITVIRDGLLAHQRGKAGVRWYKLYNSTKLVIDSHGCVS